MKVKLKEEERERRGATNKVRRWVDLILPDMAKASRL